ncbi:MAG: hypothetical protein EXQ92_01390 [Alphaproteobacteria bacterium]|nr:hypothetical protein [Alphaproteobacteria bacterium]
MSGIGSIGSTGSVGLPANVQSLLNTLVKTEQELIETITAVATGQKASNPGLGLVVDISV